MTDVTRILSKIEAGNDQACEELLPLVYHELRRLAAAQMAKERPGQTLQATALVHEAYLRLVGAEGAQSWSSRGHFFGAAAQAMRRILVEIARQKNTEKRGEGWDRIALTKVGTVVDAQVNDLVLLDDALGQLAKEDLLGARLVELRYFGGLTVEQASETLGVSAATGYRHWAFARAWLHCRLGTPEEKEKKSAPRES